MAALVAPHIVNNIKEQASSSNTATKILPNMCGECGLLGLVVFSSTIRPWKKYLILIRVIWSRLDRDIITQRIVKSIWARSNISARFFSASLSLLMLIPNETCFIYSTSSWPRLVLVRTPELRDKKCIVSVGY